MDTNKLTKTVKVSDPENWYGQTTVTVSFEKYTIECCGNETAYIEIRIESIDDFSAVYEWSSSAKFESNINAMYNHIKEWMFDKIPDEISLEWLYEHGYLPD